MIRRKLFYKSCIAVFFILAFVLPILGQTENEIIAKYPQISTYAVRPGILLFAKYTEDGQVCEMVIEKQHYSPGNVDLGSTIPRELFNQIIDELVPIADRGAPTKQYMRDNSESSITGTTEETESDYEKISIKIYGGTTSCVSGDVVATIRWKQRICMDSIP